MEPTVSNAVNETRSLNRTETIIAVVMGLIIIFGSIGNILSFLVLRRGELKKLSTCFYMTALAVADTGKARNFFGTHVKYINEPEMWPKRSSTSLPPPPCTAGGGGVTSI